MPFPRNTVCVIDHDVAKSPLYTDMLIRVIKSRTTDVTVRVYASAGKFYEDHAGDFPAVFILSNCHRGMTDHHSAIRFRDEGYRGKIFVYADMPLELVERNSAIDGYFSKGLDDERLWKTLREVLI